MSNTDGLNYTPLFHSEISSSYLIHDIFKRHDEIAREFLRNFLGIEIRDETISIEREHNYKGKGSIDLFIRFNNGDRETHILVEVKVHDYKSATPGQIQRYYNAAKEAFPEADVYFIYLTQFNEVDTPIANDISTPPTIKEFNKSKNLLDENKLAHICWESFHDFLNQFAATFSKEETMMVSLQKSWISAQSEQDLLDNTKVLGTRAISYYFDDIDTNILEELNLGATRAHANRLNYVIDLKTRSMAELDDIVQIIKTYSSSHNVNKTIGYMTTQKTLEAVKTLLNSLVQHENNWRLLYFYTSLFELGNKTTYLSLNGTGRRGFSIKVTIIGEGEISLCTLPINETVEFGLLR
jgi:hypothetical protein